MKEIHPEIAKLIEFGIRRSHSLHGPEQLVKEASEKIGLSEKETREVLYKFYKKVFDEFLEKIKP